MTLLAVVVASAAYAGATVSPMQDVMRAALGLSDNQMAFLQGPVLTFPLAIAAVPIGLAIDRYSRSRLLVLLAMCDLVGSVATACAGSFALLVGARSLVGLTSFAVNPVAASLAADLFPPELRGRANMTVGIAQCGGLSAAFALGGWLLAVLEPGPGGGSWAMHALSGPAKDGGWQGVLGLSGVAAEGWRWAMFGLSIPLLGVAFMVLAMVEPVRSGVAIENPSPRRAVAELWGYRSVVGPIFAGILLGQVALGADYVWGGPMLSRSFTLAPDRVGTTMAVALMVSGVVGAAVGGLLADFCQRAGGPRRTIRVLAALALFSAPAGLFGMGSDAWSASVLLVIFLTVATAISVMGSTLLVIVAPNELRGLCIAALVAVCVPVGSGLAPLAVSALAGAMGGAAMIGKSLSLVCVATGILGAAAFALGRRSVGPAVTGPEGRYFEG